MILAREIFRALADGDFHSGEALAGAAGVTRSAVWKAIEQLRELGLVIEAQTNRGYRLAQPCEPLAADRVGELLTKEIRELCSIAVEWELASTNATLLAASPPPVRRYNVLFAENQSGGRGRRGRSWRASLGGSLCMSMATTLEPLPRDLPTLTLVVGACVRDALMARGARELFLKWPNDLVTLHHNTAGGEAGDEAGEQVLVKLGGILVELRAEAGGPGHVVIGIGLNLRLDERGRSEIAQSGNLAGDLRSIGVEVAARNALAAAIIGACITGVERFCESGFPPFRDAWRDADVLRDRAVRIIDVSGERAGIARGIDTQGALLIDGVDGRRLAIQSGEVSVRRQRS